MNSRERVLAALNRKPTDRMPADYSGKQEVTQALLDRTGLKTKEELLRHLGVDMRPVGWNYYLPSSAPDSAGYVTNMWGVKSRDTNPGDGQPNWVSPFNDDSA